MHHRIMFPFAGLLLLAAVAPADDIPPPRLVPVAALIAQLRSDSRAEREAATKRLSALEVVPAELSQALPHPESGVRDLAAVAVEAIRNRPLNRVLRGQVFASQGDVSLFVAAAVRWDVPAGDPRVWDVPLWLARDVTMPQRVGRWRPLGSPPWRVRDYFKSSMPETVLTAGRYTPVPKPYGGQVATVVYPQAVIAGEFETAKLILKSVIVSRKVTAPDGIQFSGLFCNSDLDPVTRIAGSVVVCDGDIRAESVNYSLVIARGNIRIRRGVEDSILIAGGEIICDSPHAAKPNAGNTLESRESNPLGFVKFFELSRVGVEVTTTDKVVRLSTIAGGTAFAKAGAKAGDVVESVNGATPESAESLRRLLRDALAVGDATVKVKRGDTVHILRVVLPE